MSGFEAYHGVDAATHQQRVDNLAPAGFRPVALNVSGDPHDPRYAAVWVARPGGPAWVAVHGLSAQAYQDKFNELTGQRYAPTIVTATGPAGSESFAAVFEQGIHEQWFARHDLREDGIQQENDNAAAQGFRPRSLAVYGTPDDRRFAGIWVKNTNAVMWSWWWLPQEDYQRYFDALVSASLRPAMLSVAPDGRLLAGFQGDDVGRWHARHGINAAEYQTEFDLRVSEGLRPIAIAAGGTDAPAERYAAVFAADDVPMTRRWTATGAESPASAALDEAVRAYMVKYGIRAGTVAVARDATTVAARGYTWAEPGYPVTRPDTRFRIASVSKLFAAAVTSRLVQAGALTWDTKAFPFVGVTSALPAGTPATPSMDTITVEQLVLRTSRLPRDFGDDQRTIAATLGIGTAPLARDALLRYVYGRPLVSSVPAGGLYSNVAFYLLTAVIERAAGMPLANALELHVLRELGIRGDVSLGATAAGARQPGEVTTYDDAGVSASQVDFSPGAVAADVYGGDYVLETGGGSGGLLASTPTIARVIGRHPVWNADSAHLTGRETGTRYGTLDGTVSGATSRTDGLDFAFVFNRRVSDPAHDEIRDAINAVLNTHGGSL
jgi:CubicO group peptidase (beta-lactamase class C family)